MNLTNKIIQQLYLGFWNHKVECRPQFSFVREK